MLPLIEFCEQNLSEKSQSVMDRVEAGYDVDILTYSCLNECTLCSQKAFCFFEGERLAGDSAEQLFLLLQQKITEWQEEYQ